MTSGSITLNSSSGNVTFPVSATTALSAGSISSGQTQNITTGGIPATINCNAASGGTCTATYSYQWQQSPNNVTYTDITGATGQNLSFSTGISATTYYRRMVTVSGNTGYSNVATITVYPVLVPGSVTPTNQTINYGTNASVLTLSGVSGGTNSYTYQWQSSINQSTFNTILEAQYPAPIPLQL